MGLEFAVIYGVLSSALVTATYVGVILFKRHHRNTMLQAKPVRYFRLRLGR